MCYGDRCITKKLYADCIFQTEVCEVYRFTSYIRNQETYFKHLFYKNNKGETSQL